MNLSCTFVLGYIRQSSSRFLSSVRHFNMRIGNGRSLITPSDPYLFDPSVSGSPLRRLVLGGTLVIAVIAIGTAIMVSNFRERALKDSERELENTVLLLAHHYEQEFKEFEVVQKNLVAFIRLSGISSGDVFKSEMSTQTMHEMLKSQSNGSSDVAGINIFDSDGMLINSSIWPLTTVNVADRAYFKALKSGPMPTPILIELVKSRLSGNAWTALISHKITGPNDEFLGLVTRGIATASFENFFAPLVLGDDAVISMFHRDGTMLARYPHVESAIGQNFLNSPFFQTIAKANHGRMRKAGGADDRDGLGSVRVLNDFPVVIVATTSVSAALADWRDQTRLLVGVAILMVLVIVVMLLLVGQQLSRQHRASRRWLAVQKQRLDIAVNNMTQGLLLFDSSHRLVLYNKRYLEILGGSPDIVKSGCTIRDLVMHRAENGSFKGDVDEYCSILLKRIAQGKIFKTIFGTKDERSIQVAYQPLADGGWVTTLEDITERRNLEQERDRNHEFLRQIIDHVPTQITVKDLSNSRYVLVNRVAETQFGLSREDIVGRTTRDLFPKAAADGIAADDEKALQSANGLFLDEFLDRRPSVNGASGPRYITSRRIGIPDQSGETRYIINVVDDVTERRRTSHTTML
jgi:PAS domain S-box-containing protein